MPVNEDEFKPIVSRAERNAYRFLLRNDLDPFEFDVTIHRGRVLEGKVTYVLEISTLDHAISVQETGIPLEFLERSRSSGGDAFARIVDHLVPGLIENMKSSGHVPEAMAR
jgi:hypothetical protein